MATQPIPADGEPEPIAPAEGEGEPVTQPNPNTNDEAPEDPVAKLAQDLGWKPKDQFTDDPEKWKPAEQFLRDGRDIQRSVSKELKEVKDQVGRMSDVSQRLLADKLAERDAFWQTKQEAAWEANDKPAFDQAAEQRDKIKAEAAPSAPPPEVNDFKQRNPWFEKDPIAGQRAFEVCEIYARRGYSAADQLAEAEKVIRRERPDLFPTPAKAPPQVQEPGSRSASRGNGKKGFNDMPPAAQQAARDFLANHNVALEDYAARYWKKEGAVQ